MGVFPIKLEKNVVLKLPLLVLISKTQTRKKQLRRQMFTQQTSLKCFGWHRGRFEIFDFSNRWDLTRKRLGSRETKGIMVAVGWAFFAKALHPITKAILPSVCEVIKIHEILRLIHLSDSVWECLSPGKETWRVNKEMRQWIRSSYDKDPGNSYRSIVLWDKGSITHS